LFSNKIFFLIRLASLFLDLLEREDSAKKFAVTYNFTKTGESQ